jgi:sirohydrochlorin ferrochelatase
MSTALLLIAHGSRRADANADLHHLADVLRQRGHPIVVASFLELAEPGIEAGGARCVELRATKVVLVPYFLSAGTHVRRDLTEARAKLAARFPQVEFHLAEPLGRHPLLAEVVLDRVREAAKPQAAQA